MEIKVLGIEAKINNQREKRFADIVNLQINRIIHYWTTDQEWREDFTRERTKHWMITELDGQLTAMFYMDMIKEPTSAVAIYKALKEEVNAKMAENVA